MEKEKFKLLFYLKRGTQDKNGKSPIMGRISAGWKSHTNLTHPGKYFRPSKVKIMKPTSPK